MTKGRILKPRTVGAGYLQVTLSKGTKATRHNFYIHRLVAAAFIGPRPDRMEVNHIDGHKDNNTPENLEYITHSEQLLHAYRIGLHKVKMPDQRGSHNPQARLTEEQVMAILRSTATNQQLAAEYGMDYRHIWAIRARKVWRHVDPTPPAVAS